MWALSYAFIVFSVPLHSTPLFLIGAYLYIKHDKDCANDIKEIIKKLKNTK